MRCFSEMKRATITAKGEVQRVGYRDAVEKIARKLKITGFVENLKPYNIRIVAEGEDENIAEFIERIKIKRFPIDVESIKVSFEDFKGEFEYFEIKRGEWQEELGERLDTAGTLLYRSVELNERAVVLGEKNVELSERAVVLGEQSVQIGNRMLEKQDETIGAIREVSEKIDRGKADIVGEIRSLREELKAYIEERFERIEREIDEIKARIGGF
jgi:acylphosphatase